MAALDNFPVTWPDEASANDTWLFDAMHFGRPLAHFSQDLVVRLLPLAMDAEAMIVNGYPFMRNYRGAQPTPEILRRGGKTVWEEDYRPRIADFCARLRSTDYASMTAAQIAAALDEISDELGRLYRYTMEVTDFFDKTMALILFCREQLGGDNARLVATLIQGVSNDSAGAGLGLARLAETAARNPGVAACLLEERYEDIERAEGGSEFLADFDEYLAEYGWRCEGFATPEVPTWAEDRARPLTLIARYISRPDLSPARAVERAAQQREAAVREIESRLAPEKLDEFRSLLEAAQIHVPVSENRAFWQLTLMGSLRVPLIALGGKLVDVGALQEPNDVFYFTLDELKAAADAPDGAMASTAAKRKQDLEAWEKLTPPPFIGVPPGQGEMSPEEAYAWELFFGFGPPVIEDNVIQGKGASKGSARGTARVITDLRDAGRLQAGEILVCGTTSPPWTPLFAVAGAVVTDTGGILSHSAICAREYAIPCVVGTQAGSRVIPDGATVLVDGDAGTVTIESK